MKASTSDSRESSAEPVRGTFPHCELLTDYPTTWYSFVSVTMTLATPTVTSDAESKMRNGQSGIDCANEKTFSGSYVCFTFFNRSKFDP